MNEMHYVKYDNILNIILMFSTLFTVENVIQIEKQIAF